MVVYHFNLEDHSMRKMKVIGERSGCRAGMFRAVIDPETDCRRDKYKDWINVYREEGIVYHNSFQLSKEDDVRAKEIFDKYREEQLEKKREQFNKMKEKWGF